MVSGINFNNYSVEQLKELKNAGVQGISDDDIKAAEEREAANAKESDEANQKYEITDDASKVNEAKVGVEAAEASGANLKGILQMLMEKCGAQKSEMADLTKSIDEFKTNIQLICAANDEIVDEATKESDATGAQVDAVKSEVDQKEADLKAKQEELQTKQKEAEELQAKVENGTASEDDKTKLQGLTTEINTLQGEVISNLQEKVKDGAAQIDKLTEANQKNVKMWDVKMNVNSQQAKIIGDKVSEFVAKAQDANEYADVTIEKGTEASNISSKKEAKEAGFTKKVIFWKKGDVKAANNMGNTAIAEGASLGNASTGVAKLSQEIATNVGLAVSADSSLNSLAEKEYADTSAYDDIQVNSLKTFKNKIDARNTVAEQQKKIGKKEEVPADASTQAAKTQA